MKNFLFLGAFLLCGRAWSQQLLFLDKEDLQPLAEVVVVNASKNFSVTSDAEGVADLSGFPGNEDLEARLLGYEPVKIKRANLHPGVNRFLLSPATYNLDAVSVTASRWETPKRELPHKVSSLNRKDISFQMPQTAADLLNSSGEVFIQKSQQGGGSPMIRGFATNRLLIAVDGVRMNTAIFRSGNLQNVISIDPYAVERAEVIFGPGSVLYGSDAIGAVMGFSTLSPTLGSGEKMSIHGSAAARTSSANNERAYHFDVNLGWEKWAWLVSASQTTFGDLHMGSYGPEEYLRPWYVVRQDSTDVVQSNPDPLVQVGSRYSQINMLSKLLYVPAKNWKLGYDVHYSTTSDYDRYDRLIRTRNGLPRSAEWKYGPQIWMMHHFTAAHTGKTLLYDQLKLHLAYQFFEESRIDRDLNDPLRFTRVEQVDAYSANLDLEKKFSGNFSLLYGGEFIYNGVSSFGLDEDISTGTVSPGPSRYPQSDWSSWAVYAVARYKVTEKFLLQGGLRYNGFALNANFDTTFYPFPFTTASLNQGAVIGSLGLVYNPSNSWSLSLNASTGFRSPNVDDLGKVFDSEPGAVVVPNPNLTGEYAYNVDADLAHTFGEWARLDVTAYFTLLDQALVRRNFQLNGQDSILYDGEMSRVQAMQNASYARIYGLQAGLEVKLGGGLSTSVKYNFQQGEEELEDGTIDALRHAAPWFGQAHLYYSAERLRLDLYTQFSGEVKNADLPREEQGKDYLYAADANGLPYSPAWQTLNLKAQVQVNEYLTLNGGVENILDQRYRPYSSGLVAPGRNFILGARMRF